MYGKGNGIGSDLLCVDREKDEVKTLAKNMNTNDVRYDGGQYVLLNYDTSKGSEACSLNLETGELEKAPVQGSLINRFGDSWLQRDDRD